MVHRVLVRSGDPATWVTYCGWRFGLSRCRYIGEPEAMGSSLVCDKCVRFGAPRPQLRGEIEPPRPLAASGADASEGNARSRSPPRSAAPAAPTDSSESD